jgi:hypothetical protein
MQRSAAGPLRLGLRWFVKRKIGPATTVEALRRQDAFLERLVPPRPRLS